MIWDASTVNSNGILNILLIPAPQMPCMPKPKPHSAGVVGPFQPLQEIVRVQSVGDLGRIQPLGEALGTCNERILGWSPQRRWTGRSRREPLQAHR